jgi:hypothetical protein
LQDKSFVSPKKSQKSAVSEFIMELIVIGCDVIGLLAGIRLQKQKTNKKRVAIAFVEYYIL